MLEMIGGSLAKARKGLAEHRSMRLRPHIVDQPRLVKPTDGTVTKISPVPRYQNLSTVSSAKENLLKLKDPQVLQYISEGPITIICYEKSLRASLSWSRLVFGLMGGEWAATKLIFCRFLHLAAFSAQYLEPLSLHFRQQIHHTRYFILSAAARKLGDSPANLIESTKVLMATPQGRRLGTTHPRKSRPCVLITTLLGGWGFKLEGFAFLLSSFKLFTTNSITSIKHSIE